ncbi:MAG: DUF309 domain-containing protein [Planctomycetes bacterium]|nr:DUF309 domain-containing protein [Planctomycetota bacterium]
MTERSLNPQIPRYCPERPLPPYAFTGDGFGFPHPRRHPQGHGYRQPEAPARPLDPARWRESADYLFGIDLFNHGYYWEAHELWEGLWVAAGKRGAVSELLKGLIKLAAAGVKVRQGMGEGVRKHAGRAEGHFSRARRLVQSCRFAGFELEELMGFARGIQDRAEDWPRRPGERVAVVFDRGLKPADR